MASDLLGGLSGTVTNLNANNFTLLLSGIMPKIIFFLKIAFWLTLTVAGGAFLYKYYLQYNIKITLFKRIGLGGVEVVETRAKRVTDEQNKIKLVIYSQKKGNKQSCTCPVPEAKYKGKNGKSDHYSLWLDDNFELHPIEPPQVKENFECLEIRPQERSAWGRMEDEILFKKFQKKDKLLQYAAPAILMTACITAFLIFFFASKEIGNGLSSLASSFQQVASSCTKLG